MLQSNTFHSDVCHAARTDERKAAVLQKQVTVKLDEGTVEYFEQMSGRKRIPHQSFINLQSQ